MQIRRYDRRKHIRRPGMLLYYVPKAYLISSTHFYMPSRGNYSSIYHMTVFSDRSLNAEHRVESEREKEKQEGKNREIVG